MRCFARDGFARTSMADVISESGSSAGSVYTHFEGKLDLVRYVADRILTTRTAQLNDALLAAKSGTLSPAEILHRLLGAGGMDRERARLLIQIWAESARDEALATTVAESVLALQAMLAKASLSWARTRDPARPNEVAGSVADTLLALSHGYATRIALDTGVDEGALVESLTAQLDDATTQP